MHILDEGSQFVLRYLVGISLAAAILTNSAQAADRPRWTMLVEIEGQAVEGMPLAWSQDHVVLLGRDGKLWDFTARKTSQFRKTSSSFSSYSAAEIRSALERELRGKLEITGTGHYLVAHPGNQGAHWANRFEDLYRSCVHYFTQRGVRVHEPQFPLVAVVWGNRGDFLRFASTEGAKTRSDVLGFYSPVSNRITLYDQESGMSHSRTWHQNEATIIHEATHQVAFNTGVHNRFGKTPLWLAEGLGTMFEAHGVWDWRNYPQLSDRINRERLAQFRQWLKTGRTTGAFVGLLSSDRQFQTNPAAAYAESWAWAFFLTENYPQKFSQYVQRIAARPDFEEYPLTRRMADFTAVFGDDLRMLETHLLGFISLLE
ncbi:MAG: DUF1570 domain-containing protein [Planctomycetia bacterium]|nr:DUF1570 domain-containing protein [Planctomycetia bacterium]